MWRGMCEFWGALINENGVPSLTRMLSIVAFVAFLIGSFYLMWKGQRWDHYETFAFITGGGGTGAQVANKYINSKFNSKTVDYSIKGASDITSPAVEAKKN